MDDDHGGTIVSRYMRYKAGTKQVVNWLANTAAEHCDLRGVLGCLKNEPATRHPTAAAFSRGQPGSLTSGGAKATSDPKTSATVRVKSHELLVLAKSIVAAKQHTVPAGILQIIQDVIDGRQNCAGWYASQTAAEDVEMANENAGHLHFIEVMLEVQQHLSKLQTTPGSEVKPTKTAETGKKSKKRREASRKASDSDGLYNLFEYLDIEEPTDMPMGTSGPARKDQNLSRQKYELEDDQEMKLFGLWCHLRDMNDMRLYLIDLWSEYRRGDVTIEVAGDVTELACGLLNNTHAAFVERNPELNTWNGIMSFLHLELCFNSNVVCLFPEQGTNALAGHIDSGVDTVKPTDLLCPSAALLLCAFGQSVMMYMDSLWNLGPLHDRSEIWHPTVAHPSTAFEPHLLSIVPEILHITAVDFGTLPRKGIRSAFADALQPLVWNDRAPPMSTVFACQICIDVNNILDSDPTRAGDEVLQTASIVKTRSERFFEYLSDNDRLLSREPVSTFASHQSASMAQEAIGHSRALGRAEDRLALSKKDLAAHYSSQNATPALNVCPHIAGALAFNLKATADMEAVSAANFNSLMIDMAHFYKFVQKHGPEIGTWDDMDFLIALHSGKKPFVTKTHAMAVDPYAMLKHYLLDLGMEASTFSRDNAPPPPSSKMLGKENKVDISHFELLKTIIDRRKEHGKLGLDTDIYRLCEGVLNNITAKAKRGSQKSDRRGLSLTQVLAAMKACLIAEEPRINFDYLGFTQFCMDLRLSSC